MHAFTFGFPPSHDPALAVRQERVVTWWETSMADMKTRHVHGFFQSHHGDVVRVVTSVDKFRMLLGKRNCYSKTHAKHVWRYTAMAFEIWKLLSWSLHFCFTVYQLLTSLQTPLTNSFIVLINIYIKIRLLQFLKLSTKPATTVIMIIMQQQ